MLRLPSRTLKGLAIPIRVRMTDGIAAIAELPNIFIAITHALAGIFIPRRLVIQHGIVGRAQELQMGCGAGIRNHTRVIDPRLLSRLTSLRRNQNNAIGCLHTIDGCRCRIFQHRKRLDVLWINVVHRTGHTVDNHQRTGRIDGVATANGDAARLRARLTRTLNARHARHRSGQSSRHARHGAVGQSLGIDRGNSPRQVGFLLHTVTHDNHFIERLLVLAQRHVISRRALFHLKHLSSKSHKRHLNGRSCRDIEFEVTLCIGNRSHAQLI